jgi:DNA-binding transcriptional MerR regulator
VQESPRKGLYKLSEVCRATDTQPYVLRFWESEFPQLNPGKSASGQRLYRKRDIEVVRRIKALLYEEEYTLEGARKQLADELARGKRLKAPSSAKRAARAADKAKPTGARGAPRSTLKAPRKKMADLPVATVAEVESVPRQRYDDAVDEIDHLRLALKEAEKGLKRAEAVTDEAHEAAERERERAEKAIAHLERVLELLS